MTMNFIMWEIRLVASKLFFQKKVFRPNFSKYPLYINANRVKSLAPYGMKKTESYLIYSGIDFQHLDLGMNAKFFFSKIQFSHFLIIWPCDYYTWQYIIFGRLKSLCFPLCFQLRFDKWYFQTLNVMVYVRNKIQLVFLLKLESKT